MVEQINDDTVYYYYDSHPTQEDLMGETALHSAVIHYLVEVLRWLFHDRPCAIYENLNFYHTSNRNEYPLAPDIAVINGFAFRYVRSLRVGKTSPAPQVVIEIASEETWRKDIHEKPLKYAHIGVEEYVLYDPNDPPLWRIPPQRLRVWRLNKEQGTLELVEAGNDGRIWSAHLDSWLTPDGSYLRLYDQHGNIRFTQAEAQRKRAELEAQRAELEARRALAEKQRAELEARRAAEEKLRAELAARQAAEEKLRAELEARHAAEQRQRAEAEAQRAEILAERLRSLGIDPDELLPGPPRV